MSDSNQMEEQSLLSENVVLDLAIQDNSFGFASSISSALDQAELEIQDLNETIESVKMLSTDCDKYDYILAASSGAICGIFDIFLLGKPGAAELEGITERWFSNRLMDFAKLCGWKGSGEKSAISFLERTFKIPYDQRGSGDAASFVFDLNPKNHHFRSFAHNPTLCGLFFSILDQFHNTSHFVSGGQLISLEDADDKFELQGHTLSGKLFCAFINWFGHLISDVSGSSGGKGRGMGLPSPFWAWTNDIIALYASLGIPTSELIESINELAVDIYEKGFDARFQAAQAVPVLINELVIRFFYAVRRLLRYFTENGRETRSLKQMWLACEPFNNATIKRMLTVAHGTFCLLDAGDAVIRGFITGGGYFNVAEFVLRLNIVGVGQFAISLYSEGKRSFGYWRAEQEAIFAEREKNIVEYYIDCLNLLASKYNDSELLNFVDDFKSSELYITAFSKSVELAELREVPKENILHSKEEIDIYFRKGER